MLIWSSILISSIHNVVLVPIGAASFHFVSFELLILYIFPQNDKTMFVRRASL